MLVTFLSLVILKKAIGGVFVVGANDTSGIVLASSYLSKFPTNQSRTEISDSAYKCVMDCQVYKSWLQPVIALVSARKPAQDGSLATHVCERWRLVSHIAVPVKECHLPIGAN